MKTLADKLRAACHQLRMDTLAGVDPTAQSALKARISKLPTAEDISSKNEGELRVLQTQVERLVFDIDNSKEKRNRQDALRRRLRTGLPPRLEPVLGGRTKSASEFPPDDPTFNPDGTYRCGVEARVSDFDKDGTIYVKGASEPSASFITPAMIQAAYQRGNRKTLRINLHERAFAQTISHVVWMAAMNEWPTVMHVVKDQHDTELRREHQRFRTKQAAQAYFMSGAWMDDHPRHDDPPEYWDVEADHNFPPQEVIDAGELFSEEIKSGVMGGAISWYKAAQSDPRA